MLDIKIIRTQSELVRNSIKKRNLSLDLDAFLSLDSERLKQKQALEILQATRNKTSKEIPTIQDPLLKETRITEMK